MLDLLPERSALDKKQLQASLFQEQNKLTESAELLEQKLLTGLSEVQMTIFSLLDVELKIGTDIKAEKLANCLNEIVKQFELWNYSAYVAPLQIATKKENISETLSILRSILEKLVTPWTLENTTLYNHLQKKAHSQTKDTSKKQLNLGTKLLPSIISNMENNSDFKFLRSNKEFLILIKEYRERCH